MNFGIRLKAIAESRVGEGNFTSPAPPRMCSNVGKTSLTIRMQHAARYMTTTTTTSSEKLGTFAYVIGRLSFIPLMGVLFGITAIIWGLGTLKLGGKRLAAIGAGGIAFTFMLYGALFYFGFQQRGGVYDDLRSKLAQSSINSLVPAIEFYKLQNGKYPESLEVLQKSLPNDSMVFVFDPTVTGFDSKPRYFFYERVGDEHYYLRGLGADGQPFTSDDVLPQISAAPDSKIGLLLEKKSSSSP